MIEFPTLLAQAAGGNAMGTGVLIVLMFGAMYLLIIRPQQKQASQHRELLASLKKGDEVVTQGGLLARIHEVREKVLILELAAGVRVRVLKSAVHSKGSVSDEPAKVEAEAKDAKKEEK